MGKGRSIGNHVGPYTTVTFQGTAIDHPKVELGPIRRGDRGEMAHHMQGIRAPLLMDPVQVERFVHDGGPIRPFGITYKLKNGVLPLCGQMQRELDNERPAASTRHG